MTMLQTLADLDELVLQVRDRSFREYIAEALAAYRHNLRRAAIVLTWTATIYDLFAKIRELHVRDPSDTNAAQFVNDLDQAITDQDKSRLQRIENTILDVSQQQFELFGDRDRTNLDRLYEDRNLCVHPAFTNEA